MGSRPACSAPDTEGMGLEANLVHLVKPIRLDIDAVGVQRGSAVAKLGELRHRLAELAVHEVLDPVRDLVRRTLQGQGSGGVPR